MSTVGRTKREQSISAAVQLNTQCIVISGTLKKIGRGNDKETAVAAEAGRARQQVQELPDPSSAASVGGRQEF